MFFKTVLASALLSVSFVSAACSGQDKTPMQKYRDFYPASWVKMLRPGRPINPFFLPPEDAGKLPAYLSMGDSISLCYFPHLRQALKGKFAAHRIPHNGGGTDKGIANIDSYLAAGPFKLVTLNWGLHDLIHNARKTPKGMVYHYRTPAAAYRKRLKILVGKVKATGAKVVWVNTTPMLKIPRYKPEDVPRYNGIAAQVMKDLDVPVVDLVTSKYRKGKIEHQKDGLHFTAATCRAFGKALAAELLRLTGAD